MKKSQKFRVSSLNLQVFSLILISFIYSPTLAVFPAVEESLYQRESQLRDKRAGEHLKDGSEPSIYDKYLQPGREVADPKGRYIVEWMVDHESKTITFEIECQTLGWVGLGLSKNGTMKEADIVVAGVYSSGQSYISDMHSDYNRKLYSDTKQDWVLISATETSGKTHITISRSWDTCDPYDYPITLDLLSVIWAFGETDVIEYHFDKRGSFRVYLLDPVLKPVHGPVWEVRNTITLTGRETQYVCTIHKAPVSKKHHITEVSVYLENEIAAIHTHHILLYMCIAPPGMDVDEIFEPLVNTVSEECFFNDDHRIPVLFCQFLVAGWAIGGKSFLLPYLYGIPLGESSSEYYMLQSHYNNQPRYTGVPVTSGLDLRHTNKLRPNDAGVMFLGAYDLFGLFIIPPISTEFVVYGYCTSKCTETMFPEYGVEILAVWLHSHFSGRKIKLQQFRNGTEMEIIMKDDNYDASFQQQRILHKPRLLLPGDLIVITCEYDNTWSNTTTVSGFSTPEEMCMANLLLSARVPFSHCNSQIPQETLLPLIGVIHVEWDIELEQRVITEPSDLAGTHLRGVLDDVIVWDKDLRYRIQDVSLRSTEIGMCPMVLSPPGVGDMEDNVEVMESLLGISSADPERMAKLSKNYGVDTLMGEQAVPTRTPGPISYASYPSTGIRYTARTCPKTQSPFSSYSSRSSSGVTYSNLYRRPMVSTQGIRYSSTQ